MRSIPVKLPPFQQLLDVYGRDVQRFLVASLGPVEADDAYQETWVAALRAYPRLEHGRHLRAWLFTIATRVALDERRKPSNSLVLGEVGSVESARPAYAEIEHLAGELPPAERAAVVLRYGYDLPYAEIGAALGSSEVAARQAASSGVRRLRRRLA